MTLQPHQVLTPTRRVWSKQSEITVTPATIREPASVRIADRCISCGSTLIYQGRTATEQDMRQKTNHHTMQHKTRSPRLRRSPMQCPEMELGAGLPGIDNATMKRTRSEHHQRREGAARDVVFSMPLPMRYHVQILMMPLQQSHILRSFSQYTLPYSLRFVLNA